MNRNVNIIGSIVSFIVLYLLYTVYRSGTITTITIDILTSWWFWSLVIIIISFVYIRGKMDKNKKDKSSEIIYENVINEKRLPKNYILYLRPFAVTEKFYRPGNLENTEKDIWDPIRYDPLPDETPFHPERLLSGVSSPYFEVVGLGKKGQHWSFGTVMVDESGWQDVVKKLARCASVIFVIPSSHEGTYWEMEFIATDKLLHKTIFFMPPLSKKGSTTEEEFWNNALIAASRLNLNLPKYDFSGCLITFDDSKEIIEKNYLLKDMSQTGKIFQDAIYNAQKRVRLRYNGPVEIHKIIDNDDSLRYKNELAKILKKIPSIKEAYMMYNVFNEIEPLQTTLFAFGENEKKMIDEYSNLHSEINDLNYIHFDDLQLYVEFGTDGNEIHNMIRSENAPFFERGRRL